MNMTHLFKDVMNKVFAYSNYDLVNNVITLCLLPKLRYWASLEIISSMRGYEGPLLDLGAGDGSMTRYVLKLGLKPKFIVLLDPAINGLLSIKDLRQEMVDKVVAVGEALPLRSSSIQVIYTAFALRQFNNKAIALTEVRRVLRKGGSLVVLEFWRPDNALAHIVLIYYLTAILPLLISLVAPRTIKEYLTMRDTIKGIGSISWLRLLINKFVGDVISSRKYMGIFTIIRARK